MRNKRLFPGGREGRSQGPLCRRTWAPSLSARGAQPARPPALTPARREGPEAAGGAGLPGGPGRSGACGAPASPPPSSCSFRAGVTATESARRDELPPPSGPSEILSRFKGALAGGRRSHGEDKGGRGPDTSPPSCAVNPVARPGGRRRVPPGLPPGVREPLREGKGPRPASPSPRSPARRRAWAP